MPATPEQRIAAVEQALGHRMADAALLTQACTHASRCGAQASATHKRHAANERLEFLGDAFLGAALSLLLYRRFPDDDEGHLSRLKSTLASRECLARASETTGLLAVCEVGQQMGAVWPDSVKANLMEAILAAIWIDGGWPALETAVERLLGNRVDDPAASQDDPRMRLQAWCLERHQRLPDYTSQRDGGTDHEPEFTATASIAGTSASGRGGSRRRAEAAAATALMLVLTGAVNSSAPPPPAGDGR